MTTTPADPARIRELVERLRATTLLYARGPNYSPEVIHPSALNLEAATALEALAEPLVIPNGGQASYTPKEKALEDAMARLLKPWPSDVEPTDEVCGPITLAQAKLVREILLANAMARHASRWLAAAEPLVGEGVERERIARIIDPLGFELFDEVVRVQLLPQGAVPTTTLLIEAAFQAKDRTDVAFAKADAILAALHQLPEPRVVDLTPLAAWMTAQGFATGHGDDLADMVRELEVQYAAGPGGAGE